MVGLLVCMLWIRIGMASLGSPDGMVITGQFRLSGTLEPAAVPTLGHQMSIAMRSRVAPHVFAAIHWSNQQLWGSQLIAMGRNTPVLHTEEAYLEVDARNVSANPAVDWGTWRLGRQRFHLGPIGLLAANPFDAIEGVRWRKEWSNWASDIVAARLDTSYVTHLNYVYETDGYLAVRVERPFATKVVGATWLVEGLGTERGVSLDVYGAWSGNRNWVLEVAGFEQSRTSTTYEGWSLAAVGSVDLYVDERTAVSLNAGFVDNGFVPMASNLKYAGGSIGFGNDSKGIELYVSRLLHPALVVDVEVGLQSRWDRPDSHFRIGLTSAQPAPLTSTVSVESRYQGSRVEWMGRFASEVRF